MTRQRSGEKQTNYPPEFLDGLRLYWRGCYWHSHEAWESLWRKVGEPERSFLKALIQLDAALIHAERGEWRGVRNLLLRVSRYLQACPGKVLGVALPELQRQVAALQREVDAILRGSKKRFNWALKPRIVPDGMVPPRRQRLHRAKADVPERQRRERPDV